MTPEEQERELHRYRHNVFEWIEKRFDKVDEDNREIKTKLAAVHDTVNRHAVYWDITKWSLYLSLASFFGWIASHFVKHSP